MRSINSTDGRIQLVPLDADKPDSESIVRILNELAVIFGREPLIRQWTELALPITMRNNDIQGQIRASLEFVKSHVVFVRDPEGTEYVKSPIGMMEHIHATGRVTGDCDDHCLLLASMLRCLGIPAWIVGVYEGPNSAYFDHVVVEIGDGQNAITLDPSAKNGAQPQYAERLVYRPAI